MTWAGLLRRNLLRRPGRSIFTLLGVAIAIASFLSLSSLSGGMRDASSVSVEERGIDFVVVRRGMVEVFGGSLPASLGKDLARIPRVAGVAGELNTLLEIDEQTHVLVGGWQEDGFIWPEMRLLAGRRPNAGESGIIVGDTLAEARHLTPGSEVTLNFSRFRVTGIARFESPLLRGAVQMPLTDLQALLSRPAQVTLFQVRLGPGLTAAQRDEARQALTSVRPGLLVSTAAEALRGSKIIEILGSASIAIAIVALAMAGLSVLNTVAMSVEERTRDIGILGAIGWPARRILALIISEALLLAGVGGVLGTGIGLLGNQLLVALVMRGSEMSVATGMTQIAMGLGAALLVGGLGALWPAWRAARLTPAAALRRQ